MALRAGQIGITDEGDEVLFVHCDTYWVHGFIYDPIAETLVARKWHPENGLNADENRHNIVKIKEG